MSVSKDFSFLFFSIKTKVLFEKNGRELLRIIGRTLEILEGLIGLKS